MNSISIAVFISLFSQSILESNALHHHIEPLVLMKTQVSRSFLKVLSDLSGELSFHATVFSVVPLLVSTSDQATFSFEILPAVFRIPSLNDVFSFQRHTDRSTPQNWNQ